MTRFLLTHLGHVRGSFGRQLLLALLVLGALPFSLFVDAARELWRQARIRHVLAEDAATCPRGHSVELVGAWQCHCGYVWVGHGFADACPVDGSRATYIFCPCGASIRNPLADLQEH